MFDESKVSAPHTLAKIKDTELPFRADEWRKTGESGFHGMAGWRTMGLETYLWSEKNTVKMSQKISKAAVLSACMRKQQDLIDNFSQRMEEARNIAFDHSDTPSQTDEGSNSPGELMQVMSQELGFAQAELEILRGIDPNDPAHQVERGAMVVTDKRVFFIAVSSEEIEVNGEKVFGMSEKAPLYGVMRGLKKGDSFEFNQTKYRIEDIY